MDDPSINDQRKDREKSAPEGVAPGELSRSRDPSVRPETRPRIQAERERRHERHSAAGLEHVRYHIRLRNTGLRPARSQMRARVRYSKQTGIIVSLSGRNLSTGPNALDSGGRDALTSAAPARLDFARCNGREFTPQRPR